MAKLGLLYLGDGQWNGKQVVSREWIRTATQAHVEIDTGRSTGYGYYWWVYPEHGMYEAWGGQGQRIACFPQRQAVVVTTADIDDSDPRSSHAAGLYEVILRSIRL